MPQAEGLKDTERQVAQHHAVVYSLLCLPRGMGKRILKSQNQPNKKKNPTKNEVESSNTSHILCPQSSELYHLFTLLWPGFASCSHLELQPYVKYWTVMLRDTAWCLWDSQVTSVTMLSQLGCVAFGTALLVLKHRWFSLCISIQRTFLECWGKHFQWFIKSIMLWAAFLQGVTALCWGGTIFQLGLLKGKLPVMRRDEYSTKQKQIM